MLSFHKKNQRMKMPKMYLLNDLIEELQEWEKKQGNLPIVNDKYKMLDRVDLWYNNNDTKFLLLDFNDPNK